jgi:DNA-binding CsgD family transcriptional regulator
MTCQGLVISWSCNELLGGAMNSDQKSRAISKLATLSASATTPSSFVTEIVHDIFNNCQPTGAFLTRLTREGKLKMIASYGYSEAAIAEFETISMWDATPSTDAVREKKFIAIHGSEEWRHRFPKISRILGDDQIVVAVPLIYRLGVIGAFTMSLKSCPEHLESDHDFWNGVASICSFFVVNTSEPHTLSATPTIGVYLTERQKKIVNHFKDGLTIAEIAGKLGYSHSTIRQEIIKIYRLLGVRDRKSAIVEATSRNLL